MDALILSAGMGKRLEKLTKNSPKTLLHINGKSMIQQIIEKLSKNNITNIVIILGYKAEAIKKELDKLNISRGEYCLTQSSILTIMGM